MVEVRGRYYAYHSIHKKHYFEYCCHLQVGITAWGIGCGQAGVPGAYASVPESLCFIDWAIRCKEGNAFEKHIDVKVIFIVVSMCHVFCIITIQKFEQLQYLYKSFSFQECRTNGNTNWLEKHVKKLESQLRYVQRKPKALLVRKPNEIDEIKANLEDQIEAAR